LVVDSELPLSLFPDPRPLDTPEVTVKAAGMFQLAQAW